MSLFSGAGKSSFGNVLLGRPRDYDGGDTECLVAGFGENPVTKKTCTQTGRFGISRIIVKFDTLTNIDQSDGPVPEQM